MRAAEGDDLVDHLQADACAGAAATPAPWRGRTRAGSPAGSRRRRARARPPGPEQDEAARGRRGLAEARAQQHGLARRASPAAARARAPTPHAPRGLGQPLPGSSARAPSPAARPPSRLRGAPPPRPEDEAARTGARSVTSWREGAREPGLRRCRAAQRGQQIGEQAPDLHRSASSTSATTSKRPKDGMR